MPQQVAPAIETFARIKVIGVGGAGGAAAGAAFESPAVAITAITEP